MEKKTPADDTGAADLMTRGIIQSARKGGRVKKTGVYRLHKGEVVIPEKMVSRLGKRKASRKTARR